MIFVMIFSNICVAPTYFMNVGVCQNATAVTVIGYRCNIGVDQSNVPSEPPIPPSGGGGSIYLSPLLLGENW